MAYTLRPAEPADVPAVFRLYEARVAWMVRTGLRQWNVTDYLAVYPPAYFQAQANAHRLYVLEDAPGVPVGAVVLLTDDPRWDALPAASARYVHNLVTDPSVKGAGRVLLAETERLARAGGAAVQRLDCAADNAVLNAYYESLGYLPVGRCEDGLYTGILREKSL